MAVKGSATVTLSQYRDTESVTRYYKLQSSSMAAPDKPSNVKPNVTPAGWSKAEPACDITKTLYTCDVTVFSDKTTYVSDVSKSTSYEAAKEAWNKANNAQGTANEAKKYTDNALNNYGYQYAVEIEVAGDPNTYYPVLIYGPHGYSQNVTREILITRGVNDKCPSDWNGHPIVHGISLNAKIKCNFGGWGGIRYDWQIHDLNEMYGHVFAGCEVRADGMCFTIFLRGGGAIYYMYSDMEMDTVFLYNPTTTEAPSVWYQQTLIGWNGGTADNPEYPFYSPVPRTYTQAVIDEIKSKKYIERASEAYDKAGTAQNAADKAQGSADKAQNTADKAQGSADKAQSSADKAQNTATEAAKTADNYISTDSTGIMVSENKGTTKETPSNATKNNVLITEKDVQIRNGQKVVASYGDSIQLGEAAGQHISVDNTGLAIQDRDKKQFEVRTLTKNQTFTDVWLNVDTMDPGTGPDTSKVFSAAEIDSILDSTYYDEEILNLTFPNQGVPKVTLIFGGGNSGYNVPSGSSNAIYFTAADQDIEGKSLKLVIDYRDNPSGVTGGFNWLDLSAIKVEYTINFTPTTVRIGDGATKDTFINDGTSVNSFKALKVGKGMSREGNWQNDNAFDVDFNGNAYIGGSLNVNGDTETQVLYAGLISCLRTINCKELIAAGPEGEELSFTTTVSGTGKIILTTGAVKYQPRWWRCGNIVQMEVGTKCTGKVASGANIATGKITRVPKPITKSGVRAVSYYGNNANISCMDSDGTFYARNAGADALAKDNDCIGGFTYITDGTML